MHNLVANTLKATIKELIVALIFTVCILLLVFCFFGAKIEETISIINKVSIDISGEEKVIETVINEQENRLENYPEYGTQYATIEIPKIGVNLPVYYGDTLDILKKRSRSFKWKLFSW